MKISILLAACLSLTACVTVGKKVDDQQIAAFRPGQTTYTEVVTTLGMPTSETTMSDGKRVIAYSFTHASARPASFIPIIGPLVGGTDVQAQMVILSFGADGRLTTTSRTNSQTGMGTGIISGNMPQGAPATTP